jgi:L-arabinose 1-dehydrogenase
MNSARSGRAMSPAAPIRIGVIGIGTIARFYLDAFAGSSAVELRGVCDANAERLRPYEGRLNTFTDHRALIEQDLDAVIICVPNDKHAAVAHDAILAGVHVCVEKPLAHSLLEGKRLVEAARVHGVVLFTAFHRRYNVNVLRLLRELEGRRPVRIAARYLENIREHVGVDPWYLDPKRCGGGCLADNGPNVFDTLRSLLGELSLIDAKLFVDRSGTDQHALIELETCGRVPVHVELDWAYPDGEAKDVTVWLDDGSTLRADMLLGFDGFKGSLAHEYAAILTAFGRAIRGGSNEVATADAGLAALELVDQAYRMGSIPSPGQGPKRKRSVSARLAALLTHARTDRGMRVIEPRTRCLAAGELHELVTTDQVGLKPGDRVDRVGFVGFAEISEGGLVECGDLVEIAGRPLGVVVGFDDCHYPNHYNILIESHPRATATSLDLRVEQPVRFVAAHDHGSA